MRLIALHGIQSLDDYGTFLKLMENDETYDPMKLSRNELKAAVELKKRHLTEKRLLHKEAEENTRKQRIQSRFTFFMTLS